MSGQLVAAALAALVGGCGFPQWIPESWPVDVVVLSDATPDQRAAIVARAEEWNTALGAEAFRVRFKPGGLSDCGQVNLYVTDDVPAPGGGYLDWKWPACAVRLRVEPDQLGSVLAHELGHVFGLEHSADEASVMRAPPKPWAHIADADAKFARDVMGL